MKNGCTFSDCTHAPSTPENILRGRCSLHPKTAAATPHATRLAGPAPVVPVVAAAPEQVPVPFIEIPDTLEGWDAVRRELEARLTARALAPPVELACEGGAFTVVPVVDWAGHPHLEARGCVVLGRGRYHVRGNPWRVDVSYQARTAAAGHEQADQVRDRVAAAWQSDGEHAGLRDLDTAHTVAASYRGLYAHLESYGRDALLRLAAVELRGKARDVALHLVATGFHGTVQELIEISHAVAYE